MLDPIIGNKRFAEFRIWSDWLGHADALQAQWHLYDPDDSPFAYNETASLSFLCCAAGRAGYLGLADYQVDKLLGRGRCDLWLSADGREWAMEFKQVLLERPPRSRLHRKWNEALACARDLQEEEGVRRVAGLVVSTYYVGEDRRDLCRDAIRAFAAAQGDYAWEIIPSAPGPSTVLVFKLID